MFLARSSAFLRVLPGVSLAMVLAGFADPAGGAVIRVPTDFTVLGNAFAASAPGDTIQLAGNGGATYFTNETFDVEILHDLTIQGGWRIDFAVRDPSVYVSVIRDVTGEFEKPILRVDGAPKVVIDGVHLMGGRFGIRSDEGAELEVRNCVISGIRNFSLGGGVLGGGIRLIGGSLVMENTVVHTALSSNSGAAIALDGTTSAVIRDSEFRAATAGRDGGLFWANAVDDLVLETVSFHSGITPRRGGLLHAEQTTLSASDCSFTAGIASVAGGGLSIVDCPSVGFTDCRFEGCSAQTGGAGVIEGSTINLTRCRFEDGYSQVGGGALQLQESSFTFVDNEFVANFNPVFNIRPDRGGAVYTLASDGSVHGSTFLQNRATGRGGAWAQVGGDVTFDDCRFLQNDCNIYGGAIQIELGGSVTVRNSLFDGNVAKFGGALSSSFTGRITIERSTFSRNSGRNAGAGIYVDTGGIMRVTDSILCCAPNGDLVHCSSAVAEFSHCLLWNDDGENLRGEIGGSCVDPIGVDGNFTADPVFCEPGGTDGFLLSAGSPCVGAATDGGDIGWAGIGCATPRPLNVQPSSWGSLKARYRPIDR